MILWLSLHLFPDREWSLVDRLTCLNTEQGSTLHPAVGAQLQPFKNYFVACFALLTKASPSTPIQTWNVKNAFLTLWPRITLTWHALTEDLEWYLETSWTRSMSVYWRCFQLIRLLHPAKSNATIHQTWPLTQPVTSSVASRSTTLSLSQKLLRGCRSPFAIERRLLFLLIVEVVG